MVKSGECINNICDSLCTNQGYCYSTITSKQNIGLFLLSDLTEPYSFAEDKEELVWTLLLCIWKTDGFAWLCVCVSLNLVTCVFFI